MNGQLIYFFSLVFFFFVIMILQKKYKLLKDQSACANDSKPYSFSRTQLVWWTFIILSSTVAIVWGSGKIPTFTQSTLILLGIGSLTTLSSNIVDISDYSKAAASQGATTAATQAAAAVPATPGAPAAGSATNTSTPALSRDYHSEGFLLDILSDTNGVSIHRLQALVFNLLFGAWFIYEVFRHIKGISPCSLITASDVAAAKQHLANMVKQPTKTSAMARAMAHLRIAICSTPINDILPIFTTNNLILLGMSSGTYIALKTTENSQIAPSPSQPGNPQQPNQQPPSPQPVNPQPVNAQQVAQVVQQPADPIVPVPATQNVAVPQEQQPSDVTNPPAQQDTNPPAAQNGGTA